MIEKLISKNPDDRPTAQELLKSDFLDPEVNGASNSLAQYTYYLYYPDFTLQFALYQKEMAILNLIING